MDILDILNTPEIIEVGESPIIIDDTPDIYLVSPDTPVGDLDYLQEQPVSRKRLRRVTETPPIIILEEYPEPPRKRLRLIKHPDDVSAYKYTDGETVRKPVDNDDDRDMCDLCLKINQHSLIKVTNSFYTNTDRQIPINKLDNILACADCFKLCHARIIMNHPRLVISKPRVVFSLSGTRLTMNKNFNRPCVAISYINENSRYLVLELNTVKSFCKPKDRDKKTLSDPDFIKKLTCMHCRKNINMNIRIKILDTEFYFCSSCYDEYIKHEHDKYVYNPGHDIMSCDIHKTNKKFILTKIDLITVSSILPICHMCYSDMYNNPVRII